MKPYTQNPIDKPKSFSIKNKYRYQYQHKVIVGIITSVYLARVCIGVSSVLYCIVLYCLLLFENGGL